jgi:uncharacterized protein with HEPN domain
MRDDRERLLDILEAIAKIEKYAASESKHYFKGILIKINARETISNDRTICR